jgi:hypothetical protein
MSYRIKRGDQEFGPYSLADLQQFVQTGHIAAEDLAQSEGVSEWIPVSQILGNIPIPPAPQPYGGTDPGADYAQQIVPLPPNLHWGWLLLLNLVTRSFFSCIWALLQANWACKLSKKNTALVLIAMYPAGMISGTIAVVIAKAAGEQSLSVLGLVLILAGSICLIVGSFKIRDAMEEYYNSVENIGLSLGPVMTFFFNVLYFQYHINRIARWKRTGELR